MRTEPRCYHVTDVAGDLDVDRLPQVLIPFDRREGLSVAQAAEIAGKSARTLRLWCEQHHTGRRVAGGPRVVSIVALTMLLNDDTEALNGYLCGDKASALVVNDFECAGLKSRAAG